MTLCSIPAVTKIVIIIIIMIIIIIIMIVVIIVIMIIINDICTAHIWNAAYVLNLQIAFS